jgi:cytochrome c553
MLKPALFALPLLAAIPSDFGGWAVITLDTLPSEITVAQPITLTYTVRQHGRTLKDGLEGRVEAESHGERVQAAALPTGAPGRYDATLVLPRAGNWTITVWTGFFRSRITLLPIPVLNPGRTAPALADAERGRRLFVAKGCLTCHAHDDVSGSGEVNIGPRLSGRRYDPDYLSRFLADPGLARAPASTGFDMPDLGLREPEITALVAFLNGGRSVTVSTPAAP